jgi:hypothetical protein
MFTFFLYLIRWQLSTPILFLCVYFLHLSDILETFIANLVGGILFYQLDKFLFKGGKGDVRTK